MAYYTDSITHTASTTSWLSNLVSRFKTRRLYRETLNSLSELNAHELADLGLHRSDLQRVSWEAAQKVG